MKKFEFYSMVRKNGKVVADLKNGYTDGTYNYYKTGSIWHVICPQNGLSVYSADTRAKAAEGAHAPELRERLAIALKNAPDTINRFERAVRCAN